MDSKQHDACPTPDQLTMLLSGDLAESDESTLTLHIESCPSCQQSLEELLNSPSIAGLANAGHDSVTQDVKLQQLIDHAKNQISNDETQAEPTRLLDAEFAYLQPSDKPGVLGALGHYEIQEVIGKGGMGTVFKAFDAKLHRVVAIKIMAPEVAASASARQRFIREARAAAAVTHEHVVAIHAIEEEHRPPYLVMQFVDGYSLQHKLNEEGAFELKEIMRIGIQIAEGLADAHKQGLVHRDIKPANILLENGVERVKITDFGLARAVDDASVTQSGVIAGTPMYMSPEQAEGLSVDHRSDLFSLGTVLYVMCTGRAPFRASGTMAVLRRVIDDMPRRIREINQDIPEWLEAIIAKLHAKEYAQRYQTAQEVADILSQRLADVQTGREVTVKQSPEEKVASPTVPTATKSSDQTTSWFPTAVRFPFGMLVGGVFFAVLHMVGASSAEKAEQGILMMLVSTAVFLFGLYSIAGLQARRNSSWQQTILGDAPWVVTLILFAMFLVNALLFATRQHDLSHYLPVWAKEHPPKKSGPNKVGQHKEPSQTNDWVQLFNGKDLTGWKAHPDQPGLWRVAGGILHGSGDRSHLFTDRGDFDNFHLRAEVRFEKTGDSGIVIRSEYGFGFDPNVLKAGVPPNMPFGYEIDLQAKPDATFPTGSLWCLAPKVIARKAIPSNVPRGDWFTIEIIANGNRIATKVNGKTVLNTVDERNSFRSGHIALQVHRRGTFVRFRKIEIKELPRPKSLPDSKPLPANLQAWSDKMDSLLKQPVFQNELPRLKHFVDKDSKHHFHAVRLLALLAYSQENNEFQRYRSKIIKRFSQFDTWEVTNKEPLATVAQRCLDAVLLLPIDAEELAACKPLLSILDKRKGPAGSFDHARGLFAYRNGDFAKAVELLARSRDGFERLDTVWRDPLLASAGFHLAMAQARNGDIAAAQDTMKRAESVMASADKALTKQYNKIEGVVYDWVYAAASWREANRVLASAGK